MELVHLKRQTRSTCNGENLLIGRASHCDCQLESLAAVEAIIAKYGNQFCIHDLGRESTRHNEKLVQRISLLSDWDKLDIDGEVFRIQIPSAEDLLDKEKSATDACSVSIPGLSTGMKFDEAFTMGTFSLCDIDVRSLGLRGIDPVHCLIVPFNGRWFLHNLSEDCGMINNSLCSRMFELEPGTSEVALGSLTFKIVVPQTTSAPARAPAPAPAPEPAPRASRKRKSKKRSASGSRSSQVSPAPTTPSGPKSSSKSSVESASISEPASPQTDNSFDHDLWNYSGTEILAEKRNAELSLYHDAERLYQFLKVRHLTKRPETSPSRFISRVFSYPSMRKIEALCLAGEHVDALELLKSRLEQDAFNISLILTFARVAEDLGFFDICLRLVELCNKADPQNMNHTRALARLHQILGRDNRTSSQVAIRCWRAVQNASPAEVYEIDKTIKSIQVRSWEFSETKMVISSASDTQDVPSPNMKP